MPTLTTMVGFGAVLLASACSPAAERDDGEDHQPVEANQPDSCAWTLTTPLWSATPLEEGTGLFVQVPGSLALDAASRSPCIYFDFFEPTQSGCSCDPAWGRVPVKSEHQVAHARAADAVSMTPQAPTPACSCEFRQFLDDDLAACRYSHDTSGLHGFCYLDATASPPIGLVDIARVADPPIVLRPLGMAPFQKADVSVALCGAPECTLGDP